MESIFAPTPPLEAARTLISLAATEAGSRWRPNWNPMSPKRTQIMVIDISRAYFNAKTGEDPPTYVDLPPEHPEHGKESGPASAAHVRDTRGCGRLARRIQLFVYKPEV